MMNRVQPENVHSTVFTPREYQVELVDACLRGNTLAVLGSGATRSFLTTMVTRELAHLTYNKEEGGEELRTLITGWCGRHLVHIGEAIQQNTNLAVTTLTTLDQVAFWNKQKWGHTFSEAQVVVLTVEVLEKVLELEAIPFNHLNLLVITDAHRLFSSPKLAKVISSVGKSCRVIGMSSPVLRGAACTPPQLSTFLTHLQDISHCTIDTASEIVSVLRFVNKPVEKIVMCHIPKLDDASAVEGEIRAEVQKAMDFLADHRYNLVEIYGQEYEEFCRDIPDPNTEPRNILLDFLDVLNNLGVWCADRAALYALVEVEKLKKKTAYDRHYLLLCMIFSVMAKIRAIVEHTFDEYSELDQILKFSSPKVLRLVEILRQVRPLNFVDPRKRREKLEALQSGKAAEERVEEQEKRDNVERKEEEQNVIKEEEVKEMEGDEGQVVVKSRGRCVNAEDQGCQGATSECKALAINECMGNVIECCVNSESVYASPNKGDESGHMVPGDEANNVVIVNAVQNGPTTMGPPKGECVGRCDSVCNKPHVFVGRDLDTVEGSIGKLNIGNISHNNGCETLGNCFLEDKACDPLCNGEMSAKGKPRGSRNKGETSSVGESSPLLHMNDVALRNGDGDFSRCNGYQHSQSGEAQSKILHPVVNGALPVTNNHCINKLAMNGVHEHLIEGDSKDGSSMQQFNSKKEQRCSFGENSVSKMNKENLAKSNLCRRKEVWAMRDCNTGKEDQKLSMQLTILSAEHNDCVLNLEENVSLKGVDGNGRAAVRDEILEKKVTFCSQEREQDDKKMVHVCNMEGNTNKIDTDQISKGNSAGTEKVKETVVEGSEEIEKTDKYSGEQKVEKEENPSCDLPKKCQDEEDTNNKEQTQVPEPVSEGRSEGLADTLVQLLPGAWMGRGRKRRDDQKEKAKVHNPDDPDSVCGLIFVQHRTTAKIIYRLLKELSDIGGDFAWIFPQYTVELKENLKDDPRAAEAEHKKQEEVLRRFRHHECNILVSTRVLEEGVDIPQCNLVVRFDPPPDYRSYVHSCGRARGLESHYLLLVTSDMKEQFLLNRATYSAFEKVLLSHCSSVEEGTDREVVAEEANNCVQPYNTPGGATVTMSSAIALLNKYCAKLPSDTFTRLTAMWEMEEKEDLERKEGEWKTKLYRCCILLPINSPLKGVIQGPWLRKAALAKMGAALECCHQLHAIGELDDQLQPVGKESMRLDDHLCAPPADDQVPEGMPRPGTTKRRQYYYKKVSDCLTGSQPNAMVFLFVYKLDMVLTCPIPDEQNTRGRKIYHPEHSPRAFGLLSTQPISQVSGFPVFTRSGEVMVRVKEVQRNVVVSMDQLVALQHFHTFTFTHVLRLEKYPIKFHPTNAQASFYVVPLNINNGCEGIDWEFVKVIEKEGDPHPTAPSDQERSKFVFKRQLYEDAVVMPWYRNQDQPQYFYVAEICTHLNPQSDFPDAGFETFEKYYLTKYGLQICNLSQPLLDVDHTSGRLNLLTPRHVNRKGVALPTTSEETKRAKRENLQQKQILVPELCTIHPFPASLWRKAVCLPTILYRMNALLLADQLRLSVASQVGLGLNTLDSVFEWPPLDFGWSLADVLKRSQEQQSIEDKNKDDKSDDEASKCKLKADKDQDMLSSKKRLTKKGLDMEIGTWSNDMAVDPPTPPGDSEAGDDFEIDTFDPDLALPDNLTLLEGNVEEVEGELGADWGTGIMERKTRSSRSTARSGAVVRVGSPSNFESDGWDCFGGGGYDGYGDYEMYDRGSDTDMESDMDEDEDQVSEDKLWEDEAAKKHSTITADDCVSEDEIDLTWPSEEDPLLQENQKEFIQFLEEKKSEILESRMYLGPDEPLVIEKAHRKKAAEMAKEGEMKDNVQGVLTKDDGTSARSTEVVLKVGGVPDMEKKGLGSPERDHWHAEAKEKDWRGAFIIVSDKEGVREGGVINGYNVKESSENFIGIKATEEMRMSTEVSEGVRANTEVQKGIENGAVVTVDKTKSEVPVAKPGCDFTQSCDSLQQSTSCSSTNIVVDREATLTLGRLEGEGKVYQLEGDFSFDLQPDLLHHPGPPPSVLLQALTMSNANDGINLERLETIGDSFLKYAITTYLYCTYPYRHEGKLSYLRSKQVSNLNLYRLGKRKGLGECMVATKFEPHDNWLPPGYFVPRELEEALIDSGVPAGHWNMADLPGLHDLASDEIRRLVQERSEQIKKNKAEQLTSDLMASQNPAELPIFIPYNLLTQHSIPDKSIADCVEALIGAYLTTCGPRGALLFMSWLGIRVLPCRPLAQEESNVRVMYEQLQPPRSPLHSCKEPNAEVQLDLLLSGYNVLEEKLGYYFRDRSYLLQAFTHASYYKNTLTDCYQRLEFLGDAVLDYLITRHLYEDKRQHSPGALTDLRSALVNNTIFASLAVKYNYHKYFRHFSPGLDRVIRDFVKMQEENGHKVSEEYYFMEEDECEEAEDIEVPKALGDVFESVAGAIFLDSGMSLDAVWSVYYPMMRQEIEQFSGVVPKSPIRELLEMEPETAKFGKPERLVDGKVRVAVEIFGKGSFSGVGRNYRIAKSTAAKRALRHLKKLQMATNNLSL